MKARRVIKWTTIGGLLTVIVAAGVLYLLACWTPSDYEPQDLTEQERVEVRQTMERKLAAAFDAAQLTAKDLESVTGIENVRREQEIVVDPETGRKTRVTRTTFDMPMSTEELNKWIAAMPSATMQRLAYSGFTRPAIAIDDGGVTFYAHVAKYNKVVGMDLGFEFDETGAVTIGLHPNQVGRLPVPEGAMARYKANAIQRVKGNIEGVSRSTGKLVGGEMGKVASTVVRELGPKVDAVLSGQPVTLNINRNDSDVRVRGIESVDGKITLDMVALHSEPLTEDGGDPSPKAARTAAASEGRPVPPTTTPQAARVANAEPGGADRATVQQARALAELGR